MRVIISEYIRASLFINQQLNPQIEKAKNATIKSVLEVHFASEQLKKALESIEDSKKESEKALKLAKSQSVEIDKLINTLSEKARNLEVRITRVQATSENVRTQLEISVSKLEGKIKSEKSSGTTLPSVSSELIEFKSNSDYVVEINVVGNDRAPLAQMIVDTVRPLGFSLSEVNYDPIENTAGKNHIDIATVSYTTKGAEKLEFILSKLRLITGLTLDKDPLISDLDLSGDIQINFQPK